MAYGYYNLKKLKKEYEDAKALVGKVKKLRKKKLTVRVISKMIKISIGKTSEIMVDNEIK